MQNNQTHCVLSPAAIEIMAEDLYRQAAAEGIPLRLFGSVAVRLHCQRNKYLLDRFKRVPKDVDVVIMDAGRYGLRHMLVEDWVEDMNIAISTEGEHLRFHKKNDTFCLDVSVNELRYSQVLPMRKRFSVDSPTLSITDLLLSKLQASSPTISDLADISVMLLEHPVGHSDDDEINIDYIVEMTSRSWRWYHAIEMTTQRAHAFMMNWTIISNDQKEVAMARLHELMYRCSSSTKSSFWHIRRIFGAAIPWYFPVSSP